MKLWEQSRERGIVDTPPHIYTLKDGFNLLKTHLYKLYLCMYLIEN